MAGKGVCSSYPSSYEKKNEEYIDEEKCIKIIYKNLGFDARLDRIEKSYLNPSRSIYDIHAKYH